MTKTKCIHVFITCTIKGYLQCIVMAKLKYIQIVSNVLSTHLIYVRRDTMQREKPLST